MKKKLMIIFSLTILFVLLLGFLFRTNFFIEQIKSPIITGKVVGEEIVQFPIAAVADSGDPSAVIGNKNMVFCSRYWQKNSNKASGKISVEFEKEVYPTKIIVFGSDAWFSKAEAWNGTDWLIIWMGESSNKITEMNVRQIYFKTKKIRITSPIGKWGRICSIKLVGKEKFEEFPLCKDTGIVCKVGEVCTKGWKNSKDTSMCCSSNCEQRIFAYSLGYFTGGSSLDSIRMAKLLHMNYYQMGGQEWYIREKNDEIHEYQERIDFYEKTKNSNVNIFHPFFRNDPRVNYLAGEDKLMEKYPHYNGVYIDDASNIGYDAIYKAITDLNNLKNGLKYILVGYNHHLLNWGNHLSTKFGSNSPIGSNVVWFIFGRTIPCGVSNTNFKEIATINSNKPANKIGIGVYAGSYSNYYCIKFRGYKGGGWEPHNVNLQRDFWTEGISSGFGGFFFWNPWMFSLNGRNTDFYGYIQSKNFPTLRERTWTPSGVRVTDQINLIYEVIPDLCPYCSLCGENKIYVEDGFFGASCCNHDEKAIGNDCIKKSSISVWANDSDKGIKLVGPPKSSFRCYSGLGQEEMWKKPIKTQTDLVTLDFPTAISPTHLTFYGNNIIINKVEILNPHGEWIVVSTNESNGLCIGTIKLERKNFQTNKVRLTLPPSNYDNSALDAVMISEEHPQNICAPSDWNYTLFPEICPSETAIQIKSWSKIRQCTGGFQPSSLVENITCSYRSSPNNQFFKDSDEDGVPDEVDFCPETYFGFKVNSYGCPLPINFTFYSNYLENTTSNMIQNLVSGNENILFIEEPNFNINYFFSRF